MSRVGRRRFLGSLGAAALAAPIALASPRRAHAAEVEVRATLGARRVELGQSVYLQVQVSSDGGAIADPTFPALEGAVVSSQGVSSGVSVEISSAGRVRRSTKTFTYIVTPSKPGELEIPVEVEVGGSTHRPTRTPTLLVTGEEYVPEVESGKAGDTPPPTDEPVIVWPVTSHSQVYVGQQLTYELQLWEHVGGGLSISSPPTFRDFWSEDLSSQARSRFDAEVRQLGRQRYRVHRSLRRALFPQKAGTLTIGGPEVQHQPRVSIFGPSSPPRTYHGRSLAIEVLPLPAEGQPPDFPGNNVGTFQISATVDRSKLRQGEGVRLSVRIAGRGNIPLVTLPELPEIPGVRSYDPKPETPQLSTKDDVLMGSRVFTMLLVVDEPGTIELPPIELPYFDPETARYEVARSKPITLEVEPNPNASAPPDAEAEAEARDGDEGSHDLLAPVFGGDSLERVTPRERWLSDRRWWLGTLGAPALLGLGWLGAKLWQRLGPDAAARSRAEQLARRRKLMAEASAAVAGEDDGASFYPKLAALLQGAAVARAGSEGVGLTRERLMALLRERGVAEDEVEELRAMLDACDAARFGAGSGDEATRREHLERARTLLSGRDWRPR